jgi:hypothetical protein
MRSPPSGNIAKPIVFITIGIRFWIDSVTPPSSTRIVNSPSPRASLPGSWNRATALPSRSVLIASRAVSASSIVTTAVIDLSPNTSPVPRLISIAADTWSPSPYALRTNSSVFIRRGASYVLITIFFASVSPSSETSWIVYSPPSISGGSSKSLRAMPLCASTRLVIATAPRGDTSCIVSPTGGPPSMVRVARRSARNQIVSPGWYSGLSVMM